MTLKRKLNQIANALVKTGYFEVSVCKSELDIWLKRNKKSGFIEIEASDLDQAIGFTWYGYGKRDYLAEDDFHSIIVDMVSLDVRELTEHLLSSFGVRKSIRTELEPLTSARNYADRGGTNECWECGEQLEEGARIVFDQVGHGFCTKACGKGYIDEMERMEQSDSKRSKHA